MNLLKFFTQRASGGQSLVLATVFETIGSTYSKAGGQMIIDGDGNFCGMLSGGCLEGDLVERARHVIKSGVAETASYDLSADDELWGLGVGCDGTMRVLLQPLSPENEYQPFAAIADVLSGDEPATLAIVIRAESTSIKAGASMLLQDGRELGFGISDAVLRSIAKSVDKKRPATMREADTPEGACVVLYACIEPPPALLILGAGLDSEPVVRIASELGWRCTVIDHRPAYVDSRCYADSTRALCCPVDELAQQVRLEHFDLAIVMSHHLASDRAYLRQLAASDIAYIGLLGPAGRRERLMNEINDAADALQGRLHGPAGIDLGGRGPGPIALSIVAEMQQFLNQRG
ncbi:MAG: XdhC family protein [Gammaproteobacteria bacterium]|nr:XdhC family protein [Gammaproteobacteria bacterium]MBT8110485.1 XdhC family protein [Gammaproteobacteria bacterium]NND47347.1 XdhC family protein [Woeseiaceae bacterium]NNL45185.1 XdhC family protein [Woeseiaceae bacterium]